MSESVTLEMESSLLMRSEDLSRWDFQGGLESDFMVLKRLVPAGQLYCGSRLSMSLACMG